MVDAAKQQGMIKVELQLKSENKNDMYSTNQPSSYQVFTQDLIPAPKLKHFGMQEKTNSATTCCAYLFNRVTITRVFDDIS